MGEKRGSAKVVKKCLNVNKSSLQHHCQDVGWTPDRNSRNSEFTRTWDLASAYVLCPCCISGHRGQKRSGWSVGARW